MDCKELGMIIGAFFLLIVTPTVVYVMFRAEKREWNKHSADFKKLYDEENRIVAEYEKGQRKNEIKKWKNLLKEIERDDLAATMGSRVYHYPEEARVYVINKIKQLKETGGTE